jgi:hypothetical protein
MECPVCLEECVCTKLVCGHGVCKSCIKAWSLKGCNDGCPMCRKPMYYRGCRAERQRWAQEKEDLQYTESFGRLIDEVFEYLMEEEMSFFFLEDMREIESTFNVLRREFNVLGRDGWEEGDIEYEILEEGLYLTPRMQNLYEDEPVKEYPADWRPAHFIVV